MSVIAGAWLKEEDSLSIAPVIGAIEFATCIARCNTGVSAANCGLQCARSLDVHKRGLPIYIPFDAKQLPDQYVGLSLHVDECNFSQSSSFMPNPAAPTLLAFAERNP
jgi:hypothetical protein